MFSFLSIIVLIVDPVRWRRGIGGGGGGDGVRRRRVPDGCARMALVLGCGAPGVRARGPWAGPRGGGHGFWGAASGASRGQRQRRMACVGARGGPGWGEDGRGLTAEDRSVLEAARGAWGEGGREALVRCVRERRDVLDATFFARVAGAAGAADASLDALAGRIMAACRDVDYEDLAALHGAPSVSAPLLPGGAGNAGAGADGGGGVTLFSAAAVAAESVRVDRLAEEMGEARRDAVRGLLGRQVLAVDRGGEVEAEDRILGLLVCVPDAEVAGTLADALTPLPEGQEGESGQDGLELLATDAARLAAAADAVLAEAREGNPEYTRTARLAAVLALHGGWAGSVAPAEAGGDAGLIVAARSPAGAPVRLPDAVIERVRTVRAMLAG